MKVCKRNKINFKNAIKSAAVFAAVGLLSACGDDSGSSGPSDNPVSETDLVADTFDDLPVCSDKREGVTAYVKDEKVAYVCEDGVWIEDDDTNKDSESAEGSSSSGKSKSSSSGNKDAEPESSTEGKKNLSSSSFEYKQDSSAFKQPDVVSIKDKSISGVTQKGPFVTGSTVKLYELDGKTYKQTGKSFTGKISSDDGKFSVPSVTLASQYALLEANGYFRNEVTGEKSRGTITLNALTDLSDREKVNINLLTHLEYERVMYLVSTGINVPAAKKQAEAEIFNAFGIQGEFANSEDLDIFSKGEGNAALLAISVLMLGRYDEKLSAAELTERLTKFATDIEKDGIWDDEESKAEIADWAAVSFNSEYIRVNIEEWKLGTVPDFEKYVQNYWYTVYDLGDCGSQNKGEVAPIKNKFSKYSKENEDYYGERQYICRNGAWKWASPLDIDSYKANIPANPKEGDFWTGPKTGIVYTYDEGNGGWVIASSEQAELNLGGCTRNRSGEVAKNSDGVYYICRTDDFFCWTCWGNSVGTATQCLNSNEDCYNLRSAYRWYEATEVEYDTYGKPCTSKEAGSTTYGVVVTTNKYECTQSTSYNGDGYAWKLVYDPYQADIRRISEEVENPVDGEMRRGYESVPRGDISGEALYKYDEKLGRWEIANRGDEDMRYYASSNGGCTSNRLGKIVGYEGGYYYVCGNVIDSKCNHDFLCSKHDWNLITEIELNTKGWEKGNDGDLRIGDHTDAIYKYDETLGKWLAATHRDTTLGIMGCTTKREGEIGKSSMDDEYYVCRDSDWQNAQKIDLDTYGKKCTNAEVGITIEGVVTSTNKYYCTANGWASLTGGWNWDVPKEVRLNPDIDYGLMTDSRDGKKYKTVTIGDLTWMAENLNYYKDTDPSVKTKSWCFGKSDNKDSTTCEVGGRLYTWAAAIDSVKLANDADGPQKCGYGKTCTLPAKVQGVCPPDWHLPNNTEWNALFTAVGGQSAAVYALKSQSGWLGYNGTDAFGFSALPVSCRDSDDFEFFNQGAYATFWGATENNGGKAYCMGLRGGYNEDATLNNCDKNFGRSVRCVKD